MLTNTDFDYIFDCYFDNIRQFIYYRCSDEDLASDLAQDVFVKIWEKRGLLNKDEIKPLLYKIAWNFIADDYRKNISRQYFTQDIPTVNNMSPHDEMQFEELKQRYSDALNSLPEAQRNAFMMNRYDNMKYHEIAEQLKISVKAVEKRMSAALHFLKIKLL